MKFGDVIDALMEGKTVKRECWNKHLYYDEPEDAFVISYGDDDEWIPSPLEPVDVFADDWEICEWETILSILTKR